MFSLIKKIVLTLFSVSAGFLSVQLGWAYTSTLNPYDPQTAPETYVIKFNDEKLQTALNQIIANKQGVPRAANQSITFAEAKLIEFMNVAPHSLENKGITNLEGLQYFVNLKKLNVGRNTPGNIDNPLVIRPLKNLSNLTDLHIDDNALPQNLLEEAIAPLHKLQNFTLAKNRATNLTPILSPQAPLLALTVNNNQLQTVDAIVAKKDTLIYLNINGNSISNIEAQKLSQMKKLQTLLISAITPAGIFSDIAFVKDLTKLTRLDINNNVGIISLEPIKHLSATLKDLRMINNKLPDTQLIHIQAIPLTRLYAEGNRFGDISSLQSMPLTSSSFNNQEVIHQEITTQIIPNPLKKKDGMVQPVINNANVENVDASGNSNPNGGYLKINKQGQGTVTVRWNENTGPNGFAGVLTIPYNINLTAPTVLITDPATINLANGDNYTVSGTCSEIGKPVIVTVGILPASSVTCEAGGTFSLSNINTSSLPEGDVEITASQTNASNIEGKAEVIVKKDKTGPTLQAPTASLNPETEVITFTIPEATDPSGVEKYIYTLEECDGAGNNCNAVVSSQEIPFQAGSQTVQYPNPKKDENRKYIFKVQAEDTLGNLSAQQESIIDTEVLEIVFQAGTNGTINPTTSQKVFKDAPFSKITLPTPTAKSGYKFKDWTDNGGNTPPSASTPITLGTTYTANFELINGGGVGLVGSVNIGGGGYTIPASPSSTSQQPIVTTRPTVPTTMGKEQPINVKELFNPSFEGSCYAPTHRPTLHQDIEVTKAFTQAHQMLYNYQLTKWQGDADFRPYSALTREEAARFMVEFAQKVLCRTKTRKYDGRFVDIAVADPTLAPFIRASYEYEIFNGDKSDTTTTTFRPKDRLSEEELVAIVVRLITNEILEEGEGEHWVTPYYARLKRYSSLTQFSNSQRGAVAEMIYDLYRNNDYIKKEVGYIITNRKSD